MTVLARASKAGGLTSISNLRLRYRQVNQGEVWHMVEMDQAGDDYQAVIAASYTDSPFPLQYHFQIRSNAGNVWLHPGLEHRWRGQPYFFVRQA